MNILDTIGLYGDGLDTEGLAWQFDNDLGPELEKEIKRLREESSGEVTQRDIARSKLAAIVFEHTGISSKITGMKGEYNAFAMFPTMSADHVFYGTYDNKDMVKDYFKIKHPEEAMRGGVDLRHGRLYGDFTKIQHEMGIGLAFFSNKGFTAAEITGILLHEIGHLFYYYAKLDLVRSTNYYMTEMAEVAFNIKDDEKRIAYCTKKQLKRGDIKSTDEIGRAKSKEQIQVILFNDVLKANESELGINNYDIRGWEYLADKFASSHGYGADVATGLDKMLSVYGMRPERIEDWAYIFQQTMLLIAVTLLAPFLLLLFLFDLQQDLYDKPRKRVEVIRKNTISNLRQAEGKSDEKKKIIKQIDRLDDLLEDYDEDRRGVFEYLQSTLGPAGRKKYRSITTQKLLEHLANSDLRIAAYKLENS